MITAERSLFFLVNLHYAPQIAALDEKWSQRSGTFAPLLRWLLSTSHTGVAPLYILINAAAAAVLVWMPYTILVEFSMLLSVPSVCLFMWSFVALRVQRPDVPRRFLIPGGLSVAIAVTVIPVAISISYAAIILTESAIGMATPAPRRGQRTCRPSTRCTAWRSSSSSGLRGTASRGTVRGAGWTARRRAAARRRWR